MAHSNSCTRQLTSRRWSLVLLLLFLWCSSCTSQGTSAIFSKARQSVTRAGKRAGTVVGQAGVKALRNGVQAGSSFGKAASGAAVAAGVEAGRSVIKASSRARRASQRTWEAARAARKTSRTAQQPADEESTQQQLAQTDQAVVQQQQEQQARVLNELVFPTPAGKAAVTADSNAAAMGCDEQQVQGECDAAGDPAAPPPPELQAAVHAAAAVPLPTTHTEETSADAMQPSAAHSAAEDDTPRPSIQEPGLLSPATLANAPQLSQEQPAMPPSDAAGVLSAHAPGQPPTGGEPPGRSSSSLGLVGVVSWLATHLLAFWGGWLLRGGTHQPRQRMEPNQQRAATDEPEQQHVKQRGIKQPRQEQQKQQGGDQHTTASASVAPAASSSTGARSTCTAAPGRAQHHSSHQLQQQAVRSRRGAVAAAPAGEHLPTSSSSSNVCTVGTAAAPGAAAAEGETTAACKLAQPVVSEAGESDGDESYVVLDTGSDGSSFQDAAAVLHQQEPTAGAVGAGPESAAAKAPGSSSSGGTAVLQAGVTSAAGPTGGHKSKPVRRRPYVGSSGPLVLHSRHKPGGGLRQRHAVVATVPQAAQQSGAAAVQQRVEQQTVYIQHNHLVIHEEVAHMLLPVARAIQSIGYALQQLSDVGRAFMGWRLQQDRQQQLAAQQVLFERAGHFGQLLGLAAVAVVALRAGRVWEVHQACQSSLLRPTGWRAWAHQVAGTHALASGLSYVNCCCQQLGLYAAGMFMLYLLLRVSWSGASSANSKGVAGGAPSNAYQLDLVVVKGMVCSWLGAHVVHCLGGAWLPWLAGWLLWCGCQLLPNVQLISRLHSSFVVALVAVVLPVTTALCSFLPAVLQGVAISTVPVLRLFPLLPWQR